jgi:hypothetical protein
MLLLALGFSVAARKLRYTKALSIVVVLWLVYVGLKVGWAAAFPDAHGLNPAPPRMMPSFDPRGEKNTVDRSRAASFALNYNGTSGP